jgi:enoyl-CoA hydratase/carnithine racemase
MKAPTFETLLYALEDGVATVTLNRPERLNAFTDRMRAELMAVLDHTDADDAVGAVVITGAGRAFCAGADLAAGGATFDYEVAGPDVRRDGGGQVTLRMFDSRKPLIAAVNGPAVGVGATMQLAMDIRLASTEARFGFVFARRGLVPEAASSWFLPRLVGVQTALEWCYTGRVFPASEALDRGLVRSLHAPDDLLPSAYALAREIIENAAPVSVALTRRMLWTMLGADHPMEAHRIDSRAIQALGGRADAREGIASFLEKRAPRFPGHVSTDLPDIWPGARSRQFS